MGVGGVGFIIDIAQEEGGGGGGGGGGGDFFAFLFFLLLERTVNPKSSSLARSKRGVSAAPAT